MKDFVDLMGRFLIAFLFLTIAGVSIADFGDVAAELVVAGWELSPRFFTGVSIFLLIFGGILVLLGYRQKFGAILLLTYQIPATIYFDDFWNYPTEEQFNYLQWFLKDLAIIGGLLLLMQHKSGKWSVRRLMASTRS